MKLKNKRYSKRRNYTQRFNHLNHIVLCHPDINTGVSPSPEVMPSPSTKGGSPGLIPRKKCKYGKQCYRKKIAHKHNYSHPGDWDWSS